MSFLPFIVKDVTVNMSFDYDPKYWFSEELFQTRYLGKEISAQTAIAFLNRNQEVQKVNQLVITKVGLCSSKIIYSHEGKLERLQAASIIETEEKAAYPTIQRIFQD